MFLWSLWNSTLHRFRSKKKTLVFNGVFFCHSLSFLPFLFFFCFALFFCLQNIISHSLILAIFNLTSDVYLNVLKNNACTSTCPFLWQIIKSKDTSDTTFSAQITSSLWDKSGWPLSVFLSNCSSNIHSPLWHSDSTLFWLPDWTLLPEPTDMVSELFSELLILPIPLDMVLVLPAVSSTSVRTDPSNPLRGFRNGLFTSTLISISFVSFPLLLAFSIFFTYI